MVEKKCLEQDHVLVLMGEVKLEFHKSTEAENVSEMRDTINEECRRVVCVVRPCELDSLSYSGTSNYILDKNASRIFSALLHTFIFSQQTIEP